MKKVISIGVAGLLLLAISAPQVANAATGADQLTAGQIVSTIDSATGSIIEDSQPTKTAQISTTSTTSGISISAVDAQTFVNDFYSNPIGNENAQYIDGAAKTWQQFADNLDY